MNLVSVIVPIYNVEKYLKECIDSIITQTYKNIEIVLVNDGSTDSSLDICNDYQKKDKRIKVIDKKNGGLSSARNKGIEQANGEYYVFVDSDDFISNKMIELMIKKALDCNADIVCCNYDFCDEASSYVKSHFINIDKDMTYTPQQALDRMLYNNYFRCYAWNKLYRAKLFNNIRYPEGKLYEDIYTTYSILNISKRIVFITDSLYHYRIRSDSITRCTFDDRLYQILDPIRKIISETNSEYVLEGCLLYYTFFFNDIVRSKKWDNNVYKEFKALVSQKKKKIISNEFLSRSDKLKIIICYSCKNIYKLLVAVYSRLLN